MEACLTCRNLVQARVYVHKSDNKTPVADSQDPGTSAGNSYHWCASLIVTTTTRRRRSLPSMSWQQASQTVDLEEDMKSGT